LLETPTETAPTSPAKTKLALIEAALYVTGKPLDLKTLGSVLGFRSEDKTRNLARALKEKYGKDGRCWS
jgi:chromosome segregation and condensation protein ScpB